MPPKKVSTSLYKNVDAETAKRLKILRQRIEDSHVPASQIDHSIILATWNIRECGKGKRSPEAIHYIAEILSCFDLVAIQELRADLHDLRRVMDDLGSDWRVVYSDVTLGSRGNDERIAYLYDRRSVTFTGLAAEAAVAPIETKQDGKKSTIPAEQFWRTPYFASFRAGSFDFVLISVHVLWGKVSQDRVVELRLIADWVEERRTSKSAEDRDIFLLGDGVRKNAATNPGTCIEEEHWFQHGSKLEIS
jgi:endonuclease/exonuclease/phosphatase family metal-dependent hydrolase